MLKRLEINRKRYLMLLPGSNKQTFSKYRDADYLDPNGIGLSPLGEGLLEYDK